MIFISNIKNLLKKNKYFYDLYNKLRIKFNRLYFFFFDYKMTQWGFKFTGNLYMANGKFEIHETNFFKDTIPNYDLFINIGANFGYYVCHAANNNVDTISFEPLNQNLKNLYKNVGQFKKGNHIILPIALSENRGIKTIYGDDMMASLIPSWDNNKKNTHVSSMNFDDFYFEKYKKYKIFILIDAEGSEYHILKKSIKFLNNRIKPVWFIEIQNYEHQPLGKFNENFDKTFKIFKESNYNVSYLEDGNIVNIAYSDVKKTILKNQKIKNFLFS